MYFSRRNAASKTKATFQCHGESSLKTRSKNPTVIKGAMKQGPGTCSTFQSFLVVLPNVPCTYYVQRYTLANPSCMYQHTSYLCTTSDLFSSPPFLIPCFFPVWKLIFATLSKSCLYIFAADVVCLYLLNPIHFR